MTFLDVLPRSIVTVRHGETDWNAERKIQGRTEIPLNATGRAQAAETAELLRETGPWQRVVVSPLGRARETAEIIAAALELEPPTIDPTVIERNFGSAEGLSGDEAYERWPGLEVPDAESLDELAERGAEAFARILHEQPGTIVVSHGALMRSALGALSGTDAPRILNGEIWSVEHSNAGSVEAETLQVRRLGTPSLAQPR